MTDTDRPNVQTPGTGAKPVEVADAQLMRSVIQRVATGPELNKDISRAEAKAVTHAILDGRADPVQAAVFLIGLRMKRETDEEFKGVLDALRDECSYTTAHCSELAVVTEPYNGFNRTIQGSLFILPVLAACGLPAYSHGVELAGPKYGVTHHTTLRALGGQPLASMDKVASDLADPSIGWGYVDQKIFCPKLHNLTELRTKIVKRPVFSTTEGILAPLQGKDKTHLVTGYVHKPYRDIYAMLAKHSGFSSLLLVRGTEGGVVPSFRSHAHYVRYTEDLQQTELDINLSEIGLERDYRAEKIPPDLKPAIETPETIGRAFDIEALSSLCAERGLQALQGEAGAVRDAATLGAAQILWHCAVATDIRDATQRAHEAIESGKALHHLHKGLEALSAR